MLILVQGLEEFSMACVKNIFQFNDEYTDICKLNDYIKVSYLRCDSWTQTTVWHYHEKLSVNMIYWWMIH